MGSGKSFCSTGVHRYATNLGFQIGTVVSGEGTGSTKKMHDGKEYDYVFDIDIEDGKPPLKLPYNLTESAWDAARKFLEKNELPFSYYEQVANWVSDNTKGARLGSSAAQGDQPPPHVRDPLGTERRYRPGDANSSSVSGPRKIPQKGYVTILEGNPGNAVNIIATKNDELNKAGEIQPDQTLGAEQVAALKALPSQLQNTKDPISNETQISALLQVASQWPRKNRVPAIGVLALCAVSPSFVSKTSSGPTTIVQTLKSAGVFEVRQETANNVVHSIRLVANLFHSESGRLIVDGDLDTTLELVRPFATDPESVAQAKALSALYLNYAVLLTGGASPSTEAKVREARATTLLTDIARLLESDSPHAADVDVLYRALCALGTLLSLGDKFRASLKGGISGTLHFVSAKANAQVPNTKELIQEIRDELR